MELTDPEHEVVTNLWRDDTPTDLRKVEADQFVAMHRRVSRAVQTSYEDETEDVDALEILLPVEREIINVLHGRL